VTSEEIIAIIKGLKNNKAPGCDGITGSTLKILADHIATPLSEIINECFSSSVYPDILKHAIVKCIHKSGCKNDVRNYRPISLLPVINKVFEIALLERYNNFFSTQKDTLDPYQYGFRKLSSTETATVDIINDSLNYIDIGWHVAIVFIDIQKAFDTLRHDILLEKMEKYYGYRGNVIKLTESYFDNRSQAVSVKGITGKTLGLNRGVPQGTNKGPFYFSIKEGYANN
jgi:Reverse transcriptase (RNA-dependent DNA polymerase)